MSAIPDRPADKRKITALRPTIGMLNAGPAPISVDRQDKRRGSTKERGYGGDWKRRRLRILARDGYICQCLRCKGDGIVRPAHEVDHIINLAQGGGKGDDNLQAINRECHRIKTANEAKQGQGR